MRQHDRHRAARHCFHDGTAAELPDAREGKYVRRKEYLNHALSRYRSVEADLRTAFRELLE